MRSPKQEAFWRKDKSRQETTGRAETSNEGSCAPTARNNPPACNRCLKQPQVSLALGGRDQKLLGEVEPHDGGRRD